MIDNTNIMTNEDRKKFWIKLCKIDGNNLEKDIEELKKTIKTPKYLARYKSVSISSLNALQNNRLYFSTANYYDDPFDTFIHINQKIVNMNIKNVLSDYDYINSQIEKYDNIFGIGKNEIKEILKHVDDVQLSNNFTEYLKNIRNEIRKKSYSICFSDTWKNETLWLKYADNHKGFALIYDTTKEELYCCGKKEECKSCLMKNIDIPLYPVYYSNEKYDATEYAKDLALFNMLIDINIGNIEKIRNELPKHHWEQEKITLIKKKCHEYDREWRIICGANVPNNIPIYKVWIPYAIVLGLNMKQSEKELVISSAKIAGIEKVFQTYIDENDELDIREI